MTTSNQSVLPEYAQLFARVLRWLDAAHVSDPQPIAAPSVDANDNQRLWIADLQFTIEKSQDGYTLWSQERNNPNVVGHFVNIAEVEKYLVWQAGDYARDAARLPRRGTEWYRAGLDSRVVLRVVPSGYDTISLPEQPESECSFRDMDLIRYSHVLPLSLDELEIELAEGMPSEIVELVFR